MKNKPGLLLVMFAAAGLAGAAGCSHRQPPPPREHVAMHGDWVRLGERWVEGTHDRDVIHVGAAEGRYRRIMLVVEHSALEMYDLTVTFGDGDRFSPATRHVFSANTRSHVIDLPGTARVIRTVEFRYGNLPGGGRAQMELWAQ